MTRQEKAEAIAKETVNEIILYPESYEPLRTDIGEIKKFEPNKDGIIIPPEFIAYIKQLVDIGINAKQNDLSREELAKQVNDIVENASDYVLTSEGQKSLRNFKGLEIFHRYRCGNKAGYKQIHQDMIVTNEDITEAYYIISLDDNNPHSYNQYLKIYPDFLKMVTERIGTKFSKTENSQKEGEESKTNRN